MTNPQTDIPSDDGQLRSIVERLERMEAERQDAADGIKRKPMQKPRHRDTIQPFCGRFWPAVSATATI